MNNEDGYEPWADDWKGSNPDPWYVTLYYSMLGRWCYLAYEIFALDRIKVWFRRKTNTHAKWCCTRFSATKKCGCCCQGLYDRNDIE
jgi:hypothetical protein